MQQIVRRTAALNVEARIGHVTPMDLHMPWRDRVGGCTVSSGTELRFVVAGVVVTPRDVPIPNARVRLSWREPSRGSTLETEMEGVSDEGGGFLLCGLPAEVDLTARVISATGAEYRGTTRVNRTLYDEQGRLRRAALRVVTLIVSPADPSGPP